MSEGLVEIMIRRMEGSIIDSGIIRNIIVDLNSTDDILYKKSEIIQYLYNIEDDLREYIKFTKSLNTITNDLQEECDTLRNNCKLSNYKINTMEDAQHKLRENIRELVEQLHRYEEKNINNEEYIRQLEDSLTEAEQILKNKNNELNEIKNSTIDNSKLRQRNDYSTQNYNKYRHDDYNYNPEKYHSDNNEKDYTENPDKCYTDNAEKCYSDNATKHYTDNLITNEVENPYETILTKDAKIYYNEYDNYGSRSNRSNEQEEYNAIPQPEKLNDFREKKNDDTDISTKREGKYEYIESSENNRTEERESKSKEKKSRGQRVVDIVMKINSNDAINVILSNMYGEGILNRIVLPETEEEIIAEVEEVIRGVEKLIEKEKTEKKSKNNLKETIEEKPEEELPNSKRGRIIKKTKSYTSIHSIKNDEPKFEETLRKSHYPCNNIKIYKPYTKPYGSYFDTSLMKGGPTSITSPNSTRTRKGSSARKIKN
jgi:hypothetical protein